MARSISLTKTPCKWNNLGRKVIFTVTSATEMDSSIFVKTQSVINPTTSQTISVFSNVMLVSQSDLPISQPLAGSYQFRAATFDMTFPTDQEADEFWVNLQEAVNNLIRELNAADTQLAPVTVVLDGD